MARPTWQMVITQLWQGVDQEEQNKIKVLLANDGAALQISKNATPEQKDDYREKLLAVLGPFARSLYAALEAGEIVGWEEEGELKEVSTEQLGSLQWVAQDMMNSYSSLYDKTGTLIPNAKPKLRKVCLESVERVMNPDTEADRTFGKIRRTFVRRGVVTINELQAAKVEQDRRAKMVEDNKQKQRDEKAEKERALQIEKKRINDAPELADLPRDPDWDKFAMTAEDKHYLSVLVRRIKEKKTYTGEYTVTCAMYINGAYWSDAESSTAANEKEHPIARYLLSTVEEKMGRDPRSCCEWTLLLRYLNATFPGMTGHVNSLTGLPIHANVRTVSRAVGKSDGRWYAEGMDACLNCQQWLRRLGWTWAPGLASKV